MRNVGVRWVMITVERNEYGDPSSNPGRYCLRFT